MRSDRLRSARRPVSSWIPFGVLAALLGGFATEARGDADEERAGRSLGVVHFPIGCAEGVQARFDEAVALLHHMTYPKAREEFAQVAALDPECAMAHWGVAMTLFQPLWPTRPGPEALRRGWEEVRKAEALGPATERERLFVAAAKAFFLKPASTDYWLRIRRWERAMEKVHAAFPDDDEARAFYALALLATAPPDDLERARAHADEAAAILLRVYERNPEHPGAMHYLIHANDIPGRERNDMEVTRRYEGLAPDNPHALHMPTHIYTRLGDWDGVIRGNLRAEEAALKYPAGENGQYVWDEFPHAIEYLVYAYLQKGEDGEASAQLHRLHATSDLEPSFKTAFHLASTRARCALERRAWDEAAAIAPREPADVGWDRFPWPEAIAWFARGLGAAHLGRADEAARAEDRLVALEAASRGAGEDIFTRNIRILRLELGAWRAHAAGREEGGAALLREAADLETSTPKHAVTPGPTLPAHELLGDLLMEQQKPAEALASYRRSLALYPRRFNSLLGAARAARATGDEALTRGFYGELLTVTGEGSRRPAVEEARAYVAREEAP